MRHIACLVHLGINQGGQDEYHEIEVTQEEMVGVGCIEYCDIFYSYVESGLEDGDFTYTYKSFPKMLKIAADRKVVDWYHSGVRAN